jgi:hypothetical protein
VDWKYLQAQMIRGVVSAEGLHTLLVQDCLADDVRDNLEYHRVREGSHQRTLGHVSEQLNKDYESKMRLAQLELAQRWLVRALVALLIVLGGVVCYAMIW